MIQLTVKPDEDERDAALLLVDGRIAGRPYTFVLDTGAARTSIVLDAHTATLASVGTHASASALTAASSDDLVTVPRLEIGPIVKTDFAVTRATASGPHRHNLLGLDVLGEFCCTFDFTTHQLHLDKMCDGERPLRLDDKSHPYVDVHLGKTIASAVWDTGASLTLVDEALIRAQPTFFTPVGTSTGTDAAGTQRETPLFEMAACRIGGVVFSSCQVVGIDLSQLNAEMPMQMIIGYNLLSQANWCFDFQQKRWHVNSK